MDPTTPIDLETQRSGRKKHADGRPLGPIWQHFIRKSTATPGKFEAECKYCSKTWKRGKTPILEEYLTNHCLNVLQLILREYMEKVRNCENTSNKKRKIDKSVVGQTTITAFHDSTNLPDAKINRINCALVKFFVYCGIAFRIVKHPFFIDFLKELNAGYDPPT
ncbi:hypothetical protein RclHR1_07120011 [Rhizophagus clarus]|uniref:Ribonuclease H-like domain-containing protein n=1 Tax=Rhizophagus clarus TaxID=94130 RepID=A0A2Z6RUV7_9GLOM|nr:hypothetical protein RclHR1_07120011 [Rhizophagus clarus]GES96561.1 ribonuclease H-like domain-containing protein [Rhizophagus clarus]